MSRLSAIGWCLLWGCSSPPVCTNSPNGLNALDPGGVEGQILIVDVPSGLNVPSGCPLPEVTSVSALVQDPDNETVPNTATFSPADLPNSVAHISFTPPRFGPYHLTVRFEPGFATRQTDVLVARDRSDAGFHSMPAPAGCAAFNVAAGVPLCHDESSLLTAFAPGGTTSQVHAVSFSVDEAGRVWTLGIGGPDAPLVVYALDGGAFEQLALSPGASDEPLAMVARGGRAVVLRGDVAELWALDAGSLQLVQSNTIISTFMGAGQPQWCVSFSPPAQFVAIDVSSLHESLVFNGHDWVTMVFPIAGLPVFGAADDYGVWWTDSARLNVGHPVLRNDAGVVDSAPYVLGLSAPPTGVCPESEQSPILQTHQLVPWVGPDGIVVDRFPTVFGTLLGANTRIVWGVGNGMLFWWDR